MLAYGKRAAQAIGRSAAARSFAALTAEQVEAAVPRVAESVQLPGAAPLLIRFSDRPWAAAGWLPADTLPADAPDTVAVVRDAFTPHDLPVRELAELVAPLPSGAVAVSHCSTDHVSRALVDVYSRPGPGQAYSLRVAGGDLLDLLRRHGLRAAQVPDVRAAASGDAALNVLTAAARGLRQSTNEVLMVAPTAFGFNAQAAADNTFMHTGAGVDTGAGHDITHRVLREFAGLHRELADVAGVRVNLMQHALSHATPDAVFPNNWFSTHPAGEGGSGAPASLVLYPMKCPNRQAEARDDIVSALKSLGHERVVDLISAERAGAGRVLEGTGSLVLDRVNGTAYVALSERADPALAEEWADALGYGKVVAFHSGDGAGGTVYHTNVMMAVGTDVAVACLASVADPAQREALRAELERHHTLVDISLEQMASMCGNVLELENGLGLPVLAMSSRAYNAFTPDQRKLLRRHVAELHHAPIDTLEHIGGGSVRCTLGEIFRP